MTNSQFAILEDFHRVFKWFLELDKCPEKEAENTLIELLKAMGISEAAFEVLLPYMEEQVKNAKGDLRNTDFEGLTIGMVIGMAVSTGVLACRGCESATVQPGEEICEACRYG